MDWIQTIAVVVLNCLALAVWKPWARGYAGEKGKNLARKEDLDKILAEVRAVTITQKEIEAKISGELWEQQIRWNQRRDAYVRVLESMQRLQGFMHETALVIANTSEEQVRKDPWWLKRFDGYLDAVTEFRRAESTARLVGNADVVDVIGRPPGSLEDLKDAPSSVSRLEQALSAKATKFLSAAKKDLGLQD